jgi:hypothetical protein
MYQYPIEGQTHSCSMRRLVLWQAVNFQSDCTWRLSLRRLYYVLSNALKLIGGIMLWRRSASGASPYRTRVAVKVSLHVISFSVYHPSTLLCRADPPSLTQRVTILSREQVYRSILFGPGRWREYIDSYTWSLIKFWLSLPDEGGLMHVKIIRS